MGARARVDYISFLHLYTATPPGFVLASFAACVALLIGLLYLAGMFAARTFLATRPPADPFGKKLIRLRSHQLVCQLVVTAGGAGIFSSSVQRHQQPKVQH